MRKSIGKSHKKALYKKLIISSIVVSLLQINNVFIIGKLFVRFK